MLRSLLVELVVEEGILSMELALLCSLLLHLTLVINFFVTAGVNYVYGRYLSLQFELQRRLVPSLMDSSV